MEAEFEVRPSRVRSSHKLASCRGRQHSWTAPIWILEAWTRANLAQPDGKCRERATAPILLPGVEACGPILSFGLSDTLLFAPSRALTPRNQGKYYVNSHLHAPCFTPNYVSDDVRDVSQQRWLRTRLWCYEAHAIDSNSNDTFQLVHCRPLMYKFHMILLFL